MYIFKPKPKQTTAKALNEEWALEHLGSEAHSRSTSSLVPGSLEELLRVEQVDILVTHVADLGVGNVDLEARFTVGP